MPTDDQIRETFSYHLMSTGQQLHSDLLRESFKELAYKIQDLCPESREKSLAFTKLEEAIMWANKAIAVHG